MVKDWKLIFYEPEGSKYVDDEFYKIYEYLSKLYPDRVFLVKIDPNDLREKLSAISIWVRAQYLRTKKLKIPHATAVLYIDEKPVAIYPSKRKTLVGVVYQELPELYFLPTGRVKFFNEIIELE